MYDTAPPISGGIAGVAVLATTGAEPAVLFVVGGIVLLAVGLFLMRMNAVRRHRNDNN